MKFNIKNYLPVQVIIDDSGGEFTGWPSICGCDSSDITLIHRSGFKQEYWGKLTQKQAVALANLIVDLLNSNK